MRDEEKGESDAFNARLRPENGRELSDCSKLASGRACAGRSGTETAERDYLLGDPDGGADNGKAEEGAETGEQGIEEIDPLALPYVAMSELRYLPECAGIYFAIEENNIVAYIGQSVNIYNRWRGHHVQGSLCDLSDLESARRVRLAWMAVSSVDQLDSLERALIRRFRPRLNDSHNRNRIAAPSSAKLLTTNEAAEKLGVSSRRVRALIAAGTLRAHQLGREYAIEESALAGVAIYGKPGRPRNVATKEAKKK